MLLRSDLIAALAVTAGIGLAMQSTSTTLSETGTVAIDASREVSFVNEVMPILEKHCWECHSEQSAELGLKLDTYEGVMAGSDYGTIVEIGDADASLLIDMIASGDMPEDADPLPAAELDVIKAWIVEGALNN
ncbi:MAG: hypothetical protein L7S64_00530 [Longimicrobiales bacterium]|jgi:hypothetical protein|nr:hypothetical protein [Longimicrobiales bacterium]